MSGQTRDDGDQLWARIKSIGYEGITVDESQKAYGEWANTYEQDLLGWGYSSHLAVCQQICTAFPEETRAHVRVLDVGAGTGLVAKELRRYGFKHLDALEPQEEMLNEARKLDLYENYYVNFITEAQLDIPSDTYDAVTGSGIYAKEAHVPCEALIEMIRLVKPGGYIVLATRYGLLEESEQYKRLEPLMEQLQADGKWQKESREIWPKFFLEADGVVWRYRVL